MNRWTEAEIQIGIQTEKKINKERANIQTNREKESQKQYKKDRDTDRRRNKKMERNRDRMKETWVQRHKET